MQTGFMKTAGAEVKYSILKAAGNGWMEFLYTITPDHPEKVAEQIGAIERAESELFSTFGIGGETVAAKRFFSSDLISQRDEILACKNYGETDFFFSVTEQPPANGVKLALLGMCLGNITAKSRTDNFFRLETTAGVTHIFAEHLLDPDADEHSDSEKQTARIFGLLRERLAAMGASIEGSVLRTWIYAPHLDADYPGIVKARRELFDAINLTKDTHYIASTGIQGGSGSRFARVFMDAYAVTGDRVGNIRYIQVPEHMCPTHAYGVTFERATAVELGDTSFLFISGTASIDKAGEVVYPGDVEMQTERTLENISAVLDAAGFTRGDLSSFIVYLRDAADYSLVKARVERYASDLPAVYVKAPVCRPGWLVEIEATAARLRNPGKVEGHE
jgi:enamine deaminase RidA (YjgF/YER057c/UK114 family)